MKNLKIHVAGPLVGTEQRCVRCHTRIDSNRTWPKDRPSGWQEGVSVVSGRRGMSVIDDQNRAAFATVRMCGKGGTA